MVFDEDQKHEAEAFRSKLNDDLRLLEIHLAWGHAHHIPAFGASPGGNIISRSAERPLQMSLLCREKDERGASSCVCRSPALGGARSVITLNRWIIFLLCFNYL